MRYKRDQPRSAFFLAVFLAVALHAAVLIWAGNYRFSTKTEAPRVQEDMVLMEVIQPPSDPIAPPPAPTVSPPKTAPVQPTPSDNSHKSPATKPPPASMKAPPAPTAEEWAFAGQYTLKNSKAYRHNWGKQVRSMMGTATEGPDQGVVRFRVEISPNGQLAKLDTLWTTSLVAEQLARKAMEQMPALPPTPNGKPLVFEKTISFSPFATDNPPLYKDDCLPDPPTFHNPFAWAGGGNPQARIETATAEPLSPQEVEECLRQLPQDSIEAESADDQRQLEQWGSSRLGR